MANDRTGLMLSLVHEGALKTPRMINAWRTIDRKDFVQPENETEAYENRPLPIGFGQTISQPYTVALMLELLEPREGERILDVGSGSGWTTALLGTLVGKSGYVYGVERIRELVEFGRENLSKYPHLKAEIRGAGETLGLEDEAPFHRILAGAASDDIPPSLLKQLAIGGVMVLPVEHALIRVERKSESEIDIERHEGFAFVPLIE